VNATTITVSGNLVADPQLRHTPAGVPVASFRLASTERRRDGNAGDWHDVHTSFYQVTCWRATAERAVAALRRGDPVVVIGRQYVRNWEKPPGTWHTIVDIDAAAVGPDLAKTGVTVLRRAAAAEPPTVAPDTWAATAPAEESVAVSEPAA
jgi:single-strand DNA-binding protein